MTRQAIRSQRMEDKYFGPPAEGRGRISPRSLLLLRDRGDYKYNEESYLSDIAKAALNPIASVKIPKSLQEANKVALKLSPGGEGIKKAQELLGTDKELSVAPIDLVGLGAGSMAVKGAARGARAVSRAAKARTAAKRAKYNEAVNDMADREIMGRADGGRITRAEANRIHKMAPMRDRARNYVDDVRYSRNLKKRLPRSSRNIAKRAKYDKGVDRLAARQEEGRLLNNGPQGVRPEDVQQTYKNVKKAYKALPMRDRASSRAAKLRRAIVSERNRIRYNKTKSPRGVHPKAETPEFAQRQPPPWMPKRQKHKYETDEELITQLASREYFKARFGNDFYKDPFGDQEKWIDQAAKDGAFTPKEVAIRKKRVAKRRAAELRRQSGKKSISNALYNRRLSRERQASKKAGQKQAEYDRAINQRELAAEKARDHDRLTEMYYETVVPARKAFKELAARVKKNHEDDPDAYFDSMNALIDDHAPSLDAAFIMRNMLEREYEDYLGPVYRQFWPDNNPRFRDGPYGGMDP